MSYGVMLLTSLAVTNPVVVRDSTYAHILPPVVATVATRAPDDVYTAVGSSFFAYPAHGIFVRVALDGVDAGWFLIDTGANATVVDTSVVHALRLVSAGDVSIEGTEGTVSATVYRLGDVSVNGALAIAVTGVAQDLSGFPAPNGERLAGILGSDFLGSFAVSIDFTTQQVTFSVTAADAAPTRAVMHFDTDHGAPRVPVTLDNHVAADFRIDTGLHGDCEDSPCVAVTDRVWRGLTDKRKREKPAQQVSTHGIGDHAILLPIAHIDHLAIGTAAVDSLWIIPPGRHGYFAHRDAVSLLGNSVLERFSPVTIDYLTGKLYLTVPK